MPCNKCAHCCRFLSFVYPKNPQEMGWLKARGFKIVQMSETHVEVRLFHPCPQLRPDGCKIHDNKPDACKAYPMQTLNRIAHGLDPLKSLGPECGFRQAMQETLDEAQQEIEEGNHGL